MALSLEDIAKHLTQTDQAPLKVRIDDDASLVVIAHNGMKFRFSGDQIAKAEQQLKPKPKTSPKPRGKPAAKPPTSKKSAS